MRQREDSTDSSNFSVRDYLPLIRKHSVTHEHDLAVCLKEGLLFARDVSVEKCGDSYLYFLTSFHTLPCFFFFYRSLSFSLYTVFDAIYSNTNEDLSINPPANICLWRFQHSSKGLVNLFWWN